jgi:hypothetical protein
MASALETLRTILLAARSSPKNLPPASQPYATVTTNDRGRVGKSDVALLRQWSKYSEWVNGAINIRRSQVSAAEWQVVPFDQTKPYPKRLQKDINDFLRTPNPKNDSFRSFIEPVVEDLLVLDAGCIEKVRNLRDDLVELWPVDGGQVRVNAYWDGDPEESRYFWYPDYKERASWKNRDFIYMMAHPTSYSPVGFAPLETLRLTVEAELYGHEYNARQVRGAAPDGVMDLGEGVSQDQVVNFRTFFENEVAGRGALGFIGGGKNAQYIRFRESNRDMQFLEWQVYLVRKIAVVFGLSPQDLGVTYDVNRSTAEVQLQISEDRGLRTLMALIQDYLTEEVIWDQSFGGSDNNLAFRFTALNLKETTAKAQINHIALAGTPWKTVNEARIEDGRQPLKGAQYDAPIMATPQGAVSLADLPTATELMQQQSRARAPGVSAGSSQGDSAKRPTKGNS